jgi:hypothetical protein
MCRISEVAVEIDSREETENAIKRVSGNFLILILDLLLLDK